MAGTARHADAAEHDGRRQLAGRTFDPETKIFYIFTNTNISSLGLVPGNPERNNDFA